MRQNCFLLLLLFSLSQSGYGQAASPRDSTAGEATAANQDYIRLYKENNPLSYTSPFSELGAPSKYLISGRLTTLYMLFAPSKLPLAVAVQPDFTVRVRAENSSGVRTPSFKLGGNLYYRLSADRKDYRYLVISYTPPFQRTGWTGQAGRREYKHPEWKFYDKLPDPGLSVWYRSARP